VSVLFNVLAERLAARPPRAFRMPGVVLREAAVLVPLLVREGQPHVLFTRRPTHLRHHAGQYSFPGGTREPADMTPLHTALRETQEELGLDTSGIRVLGALDEVPTITEFRIQPFVGVLPEGATWQPNADEVDLVLEVPLAALLDPAIRRTERRSARGLEYEVDFYTYGSHVIWGATGRILRNLLSLVSALNAQSGR
jgi:8-oxo-dGTP pyrophosphatase MutT (NUDIX family)